MSIFNIDDLEKDPIWTELTTGSERACAIVAVALLDDRLTAAIKAKLKDDKDISHHLLKPSGAIGAFGPKAELAYLLSMFSKETLDDLGHMSFIRNRFAHVPAGVTFGTRDVRIACEEITLMKRLPEASKLGWASMKTPYSNGFARYTYVCFTTLVADMLHNVATNEDFPALPVGL